MGFTEQRITVLFRCFKSIEHINPDIIGNMYAGPDPAGPVLIGEVSKVRYVRVEQVLAPPEFIRGQFQLSRDDRRQVMMVTHFAPSCPAELRFYASS